MIEITTSKQHTFYVIAHLHNLLIVAVYILSVSLVVWPKYGLSKLTAVQQRYEPISISQTKILIVLIECTLESRFLKILLTFCLVEVRI